MAKAKITMIVEMEYEIIPRYYSTNEDTDEKRLAFDVSMYEGDCSLLLDNDSSKIAVKGELIGG